VANLSYAVWHKSSYSSSSGCVEVALIDDHIAVRNSKNRSGPVVLFTRHEWEVFVAGVQDGEFSLPPAEVREA
jgi:Domain of unknown function (DUF397)